MFSPCLCKFAIVSQLPFPIPYTFITKQFHHYSTRSTTTKQFRTLLIHRSTFTPQQFHLNNALPYSIEASSTPKKVIPFIKTTKHCQPFLVKGKQKKRAKKLNLDTLSLLTALASVSRLFLSKFFSTTAHEIPHLCEGNSIYNQEVLSLPHTRIEVSQPEANSSPIPSKTNNRSKKKVHPLHEGWS